MEICLSSTTVATACTRMWSSIKAKPKWLSPQRIAGETQTRNYTNRPITLLYDIKPP